MSFFLLNIRRGRSSCASRLFYVILPLQYFLVAIDWFLVCLLSSFPYMVSYFLPILSALLGDPAHFLDRSTKIQWALMISVFCISHIPALLTL